MWVFLISNIAGSILGMAANSWFVDTKMGVWFYRKSDAIATWTTNKLNIKILKDENNWISKYPNVSNKLNELEARVKILEVRHPADDGK